MIIKYDGVIHISRWAVTSRCGNTVKKRFLFNNTPKIQKEVSLLRLSTQLDVKLYFDNETSNWVAEMPYLRLRPIFNGKNPCDTFEQLKRIFSAWESDPGYCALAPDDWELVTKPYFMDLLTRYLPDPSGPAAYLSIQKAEHFIHGDFRLQNVLRDEQGRIIVLDFENAMIGPRLWDEATLTHNLIEDHQYGLAEKAFDTFCCPRMMLLTIAGIRLAQSRKKSLNDSGRMEAYDFILNHFNR